MTELNFATDFIEAAEGAQDLPALQDVLARTLLEFGITQFSLIAIGERPDNGARRPVGLTQACDPAWSARYHEMRYFNSDAVIHTAIRRSTPFCFEDIDFHTLGPTARIVMEEGKDQMMVQGGYVVPTHDAQGFAGLISMFFETATLTDLQKRALKLIAIYGVERAKELYGMKLDKAGWDRACPLTNRQREMIAFSAIGKSDADIAEILGISGKTANHHFERAKQALGVVTRAQAVGIAVHRGWVAL